MKAQNVAKICKRSKQAYIVNRVLPGTREQLIGDGAAYYFMGAFPKVDEVSIFSAFDIPEKDKKKWAISTWEAEDLDVALADNLDEDKLIKKDPISLVYNGYDYIPIYTSRGVRLLEAIYLSPFEASDGTATLWEREDKHGRLRIVVKVGFMIAGVLTAECMPGEVEESLYKILNGAPLQVDADTGEVLEDGADE